MPRQQSTTKHKRCFTKDKLTSTKQRSYICGKCIPHPDATLQFFFWEQCCFTMQPSKLRSTAVYRDYVTHIKLIFPWRGKVIMTPKLMLVEPNSQTFLVVAVVMIYC